MQANQISEKRLARFVFRELYVNKQLIHLERENGSHDGDRLIIGTYEIADRDIRYMNTTADQIHIGWEDPDQGPVVASMIIDADFNDLIAGINYGLSRREYVEQLEQAAAAGLGERCRDFECQFCRARILVVEDNYPWAPQVYCRYCDSLNTTIDVPELNDVEKNYRICPDCRMYSRPRKFTIAYFYFVIVHAGVSHEVTFCCPGCMRPHAWKMVFGNLFGLLGMPLAITQLFRVYRDSIKRGPFRGLDEANRLLKQGNIDKALARYWTIIERHPVSAGVLYNVAQGMIAQGDLEHARQTLQMAIENCANYHPARQLMHDYPGE